MTLFSAQDVESMLGQRRSQYCWGRRSKVREQRFVIALRVEATLGAGFSNKYHVFPLSTFGPRFFFDVVVLCLLGYDPIASLLDKSIMESCV